MMQRGEKTKKLRPEITLMRNQFTFWYERDRFEKWSLVVISKLWHCFFFSLLLLQNKNTIWTHTSAEHTFLILLVLLLYLFGKLKFQMNCVLLEIACYGTLHTCERPVGRPLKFVFCLGATNSGFRTNFVYSSVEAHTWKWTSWRKFYFLNVPNGNANKQTQNENLYFVS